MSTVKISELATIQQLDANTSNSLFMGVDIPSGVTGKFTAHTLAQGLYSNEVLNVGSNPIIFPNVAAQFSGNGTSYLQVNLQNFDGNASGDIVVTADNGTNETNFIDLGINGSTYDVGAYGALKKNDGYLIIVGEEGSFGGNLTLGTATSNTRINFINSGFELNNIVGFIDNTGAHFENIDSRANAAYAKANSALANTSGTFDGNLTVTGMLSVNNASFGSNSQAMSITASAGFARQPAAGDGYMLHATGKDSLPAKIILDSFGANVYSVFSGRSGRGTAAAPSATQANDIIARYSSSSYGGANSGFLQFGVGRMDFVATENHSDSNRGTEIQMWTVNNGSNTLTRTASFTGTSASFPGVVSANNLVVTGSITANVVSGNTLFSNLSTVTTTANAVVFNLQANIPSQVSGQLWYKSDIQALVFDTDIMGDRPGLGRTIYERVYNGSGANFPDGTFVRLAGLTTANAIPYVVLADATTAANSAVSGYIKTGIANGAYGYAYVSGVVETANTSAFQNGENIYLSTTPGAASNVAPYGPSIATVQVGKILYANNTTGKLQVQFNLVQAYGKANGSIMYANNNLMVASNTVNINEVAGTVSIANGIINTTRTLAGNQTAFNVNFTNDTIVRANISGTNLAITPTNFVAGKEVKVWVTNTAAGGRVVTHGCTAMNATGGSTTYNLPANATMFLRYMCFNNDLGNVYVSATF